MVNRTNNHVLKLTVMIAFVIITVSCVAVTLGMHMIVDAEQDTVRTQTEKLTKARYKYYEQNESIHASSMSWINERNQCSVVQIIGRSMEPNVTLEIYLNGKLADMEEPIASMTQELNKMFEADVEQLVITFCNKNQIDYSRDAIKKLEVEEFMDLISVLQEGTKTEL